MGRGAGWRTQWTLPALVLHGETEAPGWCRPRRGPGDRLSPPGEALGHSGLGAQAPISSAPSLGGKAGARVRGSGQGTPQARSCFCRSLGLLSEAGEGKTRVPWEAAPRHPSAPQQLPRQAWECDRRGKASPRGMSCWAPAKDTQIQRGSKASRGSLTRASGDAEGPWPALIPGSPDSRQPRPRPQSDPGHRLSCHPRHRLSFDHNRGRIPGPGYNLTHHPCHSLSPDLGLSRALIQVMD